MRFQLGSAGSRVLEGARGNLHLTLSPPTSACKVLQCDLLMVPPAGGRQRDPGKYISQEGAGLSDAGQQEQRDCESFMSSDSQWVT